MKLIEKNRRLSSGIISTFAVTITLILFAVIFWTDSGAKVYAANFNWSTLPAVTPSNYVNISADMHTYGLNATNRQGKISGAASNHYNDIMVGESPSRWTYMKKIAVSQGTTVSLIGAIADNYAGGGTTQHNGAFYWSVVEFDANGNGLYDSGWMDTTSSWVVGSQTSTGICFEGVTSRSNVAYVLLVFRVNNGNPNVNTGYTTTISTADLANYLGNIYLMTSPFVYTANANGGNMNGAATHYYQRYGLNKAFSNSNTLLVNPTRAGYTFAGWKVSSPSTLSPNWLNGNTYTTETLNGYITNGRFYNSLFANVNFTAQWMANQYMLTLHANGCKFSNGQTSYNLSPNLIYGTQNWITVPTITRTGYTFKGYYTSPSGGKQIYDATGRATNDGTYWKHNKYCYTGNCTLYAQWQLNNYTVTYDANDEQGNATVSKSTEEVFYQQAVNLNITAEKEGYIFVGWNTSPDAKTALASYTMPAGNVTLYAIYSIPVSDVKEVYLQAWVAGAENDCRLYPLSMTGQNMRGYNYKLNRTDVGADFGGASVSCAVVAWDNAGNHSVLWGAEPPPIEKYWQSVEHYYQDVASGDWIRFAVVAEQRLSGEEYTPQYISPPDGYQEYQIDAPYIVRGDTVSKAYYTPITYTLYFDPNGGSCSMESKSIRCNEVYGELPTAEREGHSFLGWFTEPEGGNRVVSSDVYAIAGDSTLYAHWEVNLYTVRYEYLTNGGSFAEKTMEQVVYGAEVDLNVAAVKDGYEHIGWNTNQDATEGLNSLVMGNQDVVLYAIYKKDISVSFVDCRDIDENVETDKTIQTKETIGNTTITRAATFTLYNRTELINITIPTQNPWTGWQAEGWSIGTDADAEIDAAEGAEYAISEDTNFYGRYSRAVTVSYDTGDVKVEIPEETKVRQYNASGQYQNPVFTLAQAPNRENYSFVSWKAEAGIGRVPEQEAETEHTPEQEIVAEYPPAQEIEIEKDTLFVAVWDRYPEIEAYDRYFSLEQAQNGNITSTVLLEKVIGTDLEDGTLTNGTDVVVIYYQPQEFMRMTEEGGVSVTYQATDSFGNVTTKLVMVHVVDTSARNDTLEKYIRFISTQFYKDNEGYVDADFGGLEEYSIWRTNPAYSAALGAALSNNTSHEKWIFTREEVEAVQRFVQENGLGNYQTADGVAKFCQQFSSCRE